jgi:hypothetical protein
MPFEQARQKCGSLPLQSFAVVQDCVCGTFFAIGFGEGKEDGSGEESAYAVPNPIPKKISGKAKVVNLFNLMNQIL